MLKQRKSVSTRATMPFSGSLRLTFFAELWSIFHSELDLDGNGRLDAEELAVALQKAGLPSPIKLLNHP